MSGRRGTRPVGAILPALLAAACGGPAAGEPDGAVTAILPPAETSAQTTALGPFAVTNAAQSSTGENSADRPPAADPDAVRPTPLADSRYTSLDPSACTPVADNAQAAEAGRRRCAGAVDYALETGESGQQQDLAIIAPDGQRAQLRVPKLVSNARLGKTAEWRRDESGRPRALILRINADSETAANSKVSDLVVTRLAMPACVVAVVPRGPGQNEKARAIADAKRLECMEE